MKILTCSHLSWLIHVYRFELISSDRRMIKRRYAFHTERESNKETVFNNSEILLYFPALLQINVFEEQFGNCESRLREEINKN